MHCAQTSSLMAPPASVMRRVSAATPTAARLWCGRLHTTNSTVLRDNVTDRSERYRTARRSSNSEAPQKEPQAAYDCVSPITMLFQGNCKSSHPRVVESLWGAAGRRT